MFSKPYCNLTSILTGKTGKSNRWTNLESSSISVKLQETGDRAENTIISAHYFLSSLITAVNQQVLHLLKDEDPQRK